MHTNRTTLAAVLSIALAVAPGAVASQTADEEPGPVSYWTGTNTEGQSFPVLSDEVGVIPGGYRTTVGLTYTAEADDPRASGDVAVAMVWDYTGISGDSLGHGTGVTRLVNKDGSFVGTAQAIAYPDGSEFRMSVMEGQDGYEGLNLTMTQFVDPAGEGQPQGLIWEAEAPTMPSVEMLPE